MTSTPTPQHDAPMGVEDFDAQDATLDDLRERNEDTPDWEFCEGFLAALVCCRRPIEPDAYWPVLLGEDFRPMAHMEFVWRWQRRWREVAAGLDAEVDTLEDELAYQPELLDVRGAVLALPEGERGDADLAQLPSFGEAWAHGFLHAVRQWSDEWTSPRDREAAQILREALAAIAALAAPDTGKPSVSMHTEGGPPSVSERRLEEFGKAVWSVYDLRQLWKSMGPRQVTVRKDAGPRRNDPCPCGSEKKYKKCCGH